MKKTALEVGFDAVGIAEAGFLEKDSEFLKKWLSQDFAGNMGYMHQNFDKRVNPQLLIEKARSVIVVLLNYFPSQQQNHSAPKIAKYAYGKDYHYIVKEKLRKIVETIPEIKIDIQQCFCDSAPVLERRWAEKAGLGWIGKNTCLINKTLGSYFFIGEIITDVELLYDNPIVPSHCGTCSRCVDACPTKALVSPHVIDARKCISYQTIENKEDIPLEIGEVLSGNVFGCDICQDVCPWNKKAKFHSCHEFVPSDFLEMELKDWVNIDKNIFNQLFKHSPLQRAGLEKIKKNIQFFVPK